MSVILEYTAVGKDVPQLHTELIRAALVPDRVETRIEPGDATVPDEPIVVLTFPDGTVEASVDAVVSAHQPMAHYDTAEQRARIARVREIARLKADYAEVLRMGEALTTFDDAITCLTFLIETLIRRDRAAGLY